MVWQLPFIKSLTRYLFRVFVLFICIQQAKGQTHFIDSLESELKKTHNDSVSVYLIIDLAAKYFTYDSVKALRYLDNGYKMAKKLNWDYLYGYYYDHKATIRQLADDGVSSELYFDSAIYYYQKSADAKHNPKETADAILSIASAKGQKGDRFVANGKYKEAIAEYITALEAWKNSGNETRFTAMGTYYSRISTVYYKMNQFDKALEYDKLSLALVEHDGNEENTVWALLYVCDDFNGLRQLDSSLLYLSRAKPMVERLNNFRINIQYYNKLGSVSRQKKEYKTAIGYYNKTLSTARSNHFKYQTTSALKIIGLCYEQLADYAQARKYLLMAMQEAANESTFQAEKIEILQELVNVEKKTNNGAQAFIYLEQLNILKDSLNIQASKKSVAEIENKYQAAEKGKRIAQLQAEKEIQILSIRQKSLLNYFLISSVLALLIVGFLGFRNFRNRHLLAKKQDELHQQRIGELEKDRQLVAVDSMLKGQEDERSRLAKDLHDGLGGLLSGVKFSLSNMKDNLIVTPDNMAVFERSLDMIDTSIKELRRVAHNMMPEMLTKFGLDEALKEYGNTINSAKLLVVKYQSFGMEARLDKSVEIIIYRIVQELLNNILKHAAATEAFVQIMREGNRLNVIVEDNGKGFDAALPENNMGAGLLSVRSRVDYLKGQLAIDAKPGKGTLVNIELNIQP
ncbi:MAG TPA: sensor histidine kinase [Puia sp.]|nr:sensor histidine kinase [Puia sp.]